jgi:REP-associated tyrosine transposase
LPGDSQRFDRSHGLSILVTLPKVTKEIEMRDYKSLAHTRWDCKYHIVFIPKYRQKIIYGKLRSYIGEMFHDLASHRESKIEEGHMMGDHIHMCISIPPKYPVSKVVGYIKGKSAIMIARRFGSKARNYKGESFWARGYFVSTVGLDEEMVREYIRTQDERDKYFDQQSLPL